MSEEQVMQRAAQLLSDVDHALHRGDLAEAMEYLQAARALIEGLEHQHAQQKALGHLRPRARV